MASPSPTYIVDPAVVAPVTPVIIVGGTFTGALNVDSVGIRDSSSGKTAEVVTASSAKNGNDAVLLVQPIDATGKILSTTEMETELDNILVQGTNSTNLLSEIYTVAGASYLVQTDQDTKLGAIQDSGTRVQGILNTVAMNTENTIVAIDEQTDTIGASNRLLTVIMNNQGTQTGGGGGSSPTDNTVLRVIMNNQGTQATAAHQVEQIATVGASNAILDAIMNHQGTLATHADAVASQAILSAILGKLPASAYAQFAAVNGDTFQHIPGTVVYISGSGTVQAAVANSSLTANAVAIAAGTVASFQSGQYQTDGLAGGFAGLTPAAVYFLDPAILGGVTVTAPVITGQWVKVVGVAYSTTQVNIAFGTPVLL